MRREEMNRERELKVVLDRERLDQVVRNARGYIMSRGEKKEEGWPQFNKENIVARQRIDSIKKALRAIEVDREERNKEDPEKVDLIEEEEKDIL